MSVILLLMYLAFIYIPGFPSSSDGKESACNVGDLGPVLGSENTLEKGMATHSSVLAWRISWTEETGELQFTVLQSQTHLSD